jgi:hypothetical protein
MERTAMRFTVVKVVPDPVRYEPINIGVIVHDLKSGTARARFSEDLDRLKTYTFSDEPLDLESIEELSDSVAEMVGRGAIAEDLLDNLARSHNQVIQFTDPAGTLSESLDNEVDKLYARFVTLDRRGKHEVRTANKNRVVSTVRRLFEELQMPYERRFRAQGDQSSFVFDFVLREPSTRVVQCFTFGAPAKHLDTLNDAKALLWSIHDISEHARRIDSNELIDLKVSSLVYPPPTPTDISASVSTILGRETEVVNAAAKLDNYFRSIAPSKA